MGAAAVGIGEAACVCVCVCACAGLASISRVGDVAPGKWSSRGPIVEPGLVVLGPAWSSLEGKVGAGEAPSGWTTRLG